MERKQYQAHPRVEGLESMTLLSGATGALAGAVPAAVQSLPLAPEPITLVGQAHGSYVARQSNPDTGTHYTLAAEGRVSPLGPTFLTGSFTTPGFIHNGTTEGTLTLRDARGSITMKIATFPSSTAASSAGGQSTIEFAYTVTGGTGRFRNASGHGLVFVKLNPVGSWGNGTQHVGVGRVSIRITPLPTGLV
jgi:hypothetical protein